MLLQTNCTSDNRHPFLRSCFMQTFEIVVPGLVSWSSSFRYFISDTSQTTYTASGLTTALGYRFRVAVVSEVGESNPSGIVTFYPGELADPPGAPVYISSTATALTVGWSPGDSSGGNTITNWRLEASNTLVSWPNDPAALTPATVLQATVNCNPIAAANLVQNWVYFRVAAITAATQGYYSWSHGTGLSITPQKSQRFSHIFRTCHAHARSPCCIHGRNALYHTQTCNTNDKKW